MPTESTESASRVSGLFYDKWASIRPEIAIPGYWNTLFENCAQWAEYVSVCPFWKEFDKRRPSWSNEFHQKAHGSLLARDTLPRFIGKGIDRIQKKILQLAGDKGHDKLENIWSKSGAPVPKLNDLVRTRVECAFLDGVEFVGTKLEDLAKEMKIPITRERQGRLEGYFAQHIHFECPVFFRFGGINQTATIQCEVQVATQLATRIWEQSHVVYEEWRGRKESQGDWQWDPTDHRFIARQLGHMIHLADGLLVQLRDARGRERI